MSPRLSTCLAFLWLQLQACIFGVAILSAIVLTHWYYPEGAWLYRYDFLTLFALGFQVFLWRMRWEDRQEMKVILIFHILGTTMEVFKTSMGSWQYPHAAWFRIEGVPLFTGFMYASVGSYFARSWRLFHWRFQAHPSLSALWILVLAIYINFYTHHYWYDVRWLLFLGIVCLFYRTTLQIQVLGQWSPKLPVLVIFTCISGLLWIAENIGTFTRTWAYQGQSMERPLVSLAKMGSWFLLIFLSYSLVALVHRSSLQSKQAIHPL